MIRKAKKSDFYDLWNCMRSSDRTEFSATIDPDSQDDWISGMSTPSAIEYAFTISSNESNVPIAIGGFFPMRPGVAQSWLLCAEGVNNYKHTFVRDIIDIHKKQLGTHYHRIYCFSMKKVQNAKWLKLIGYELEGVHKGFGINKEDFCSWAMTHG